MDKSVDLPTNEIWAMANHNDRMFKENFFINFLPIIEKILGLDHIQKTEEITEKLQHTMEREHDVDGQSSFG